MEVTDIQNAIKEGHILITDHADEEAQNDNLTYDEIYFSVLTAYNKDTKWTVLVTVYRPNPDK